MREVSCVRSPFLIVNAEWSLVFWSFRILLYRVKNDSFKLTKIIIILSRLCSSPLLQRQDKDLEKMTRLHISREEMNDVATYLPKDKRPEYIQQEYIEVESKLMDIVNKLPKIDYSVES